MKKLVLLVLCAGLLMWPVMSHKGSVASQTQPLMLSTPSESGLNVMESRPIRRLPRASRSRPTPTATALRRVHTFGGLATSKASQWAQTRSALAVAECESGRDGSARSHTGKYRGKWQMDASFWATYGGLKYASSPDYASVTEQDEVAYRGFLARGWQPWTCARIVGIYP